MSLGTLAIVGGRQCGKGKTIIRAIREQLETENLPEYATQPEIGESVIVDKALPSPQHVIVSDLKSMSVESALDALCLTDVSKTFTMCERKPSPIYIPKKGKKKKSRKLK